MQDSEFLRECKLIDYSLLLVKINWNLYQKDGSVVGFGQCPLNCQSCANLTYCNACNPNFKLLQSKSCGCLDGFYLDISTNLCTSKFNLLNIFKVSY